MSDNDLCVPTEWRGWVWQGGDSPAALQDCYLSAQSLEPDDMLVHNAAIGLTGLRQKARCIGYRPNISGMKSFLIPNLPGMWSLFMTTIFRVDARWIRRETSTYQKLKLITLLCGLLMEKVRYWLATHDWCVRTVLLSHPTENSGFR